MIVHIFVLTDMYTPCLGMVKINFASALDFGCIRASHSYIKDHNFSKHENTGSHFCSTKFISRHIMHTDGHRQCKRNTAPRTCPPSWRIHSSRKMQYQQNHRQESGRRGIPYYNKRRRYPRISLGRARLSLCRPDSLTTCRYSGGLSECNHS